MVAATPRDAAPVLRARAWILEDATTGQLLTGHAAHDRLPIASTTKLMTAHIALERLPLSARIAAPRYRPLPGESVAGLRAGERVSVRDLVYALVLASANDAALTLARGVAGSEARFVKQMNASAIVLGLTETHYSNAIGLDQPGNYSSAADLATLSRLLLRNPTFREVAATRRVVLRSGDRPRRFVTRNTLLLDDPSATGVKTGHTVDAGYVLVGSAKRHGVALISAVLGAPSEDERDADSERLLDWGFSRFSPRTAVRARQVLASPRLSYRDERLPLLAARGASLGLLPGQRLDVQIEGPSVIDGPVREGQRIGRALVTVDGRQAAVVPLVASRAVPAASVVDKIRDRAGKPLVLLLVAIIMVLVGVALVARRQARRRGGERA